MQAIPNTRSTTTFLVPEPWKQWPEFPLPEFDGKAQFEAWRTSATTQHAFISGVEGLNPKLRVSDKDAAKDMDNPPASMSAYIADYDTAVSDEKIGVYLADSPATFHPSWVVKSFSGEGDSGRSKRRLVWVFEKPVRLAGSAHAKNFYKVIADQLRPRKWLDGYDQSGHRPSMYFEIGRDWTAISSVPIPHSVVLGWACEAAKNLDFTDGKERPTVSLEKIAEAVADQFPGRWLGDFSRGSSGVRFWDSSADNPRGCVVGDHGMICFTGPKNFVSWEEIFGSKFIEELRGNRWGKFMENFYYTPAPSKFWRKSPATGKWRQCSLEEARRAFRADYISSARKGGGPSEMDLLEEAIVNLNEVVAALPFVHRPMGELMFEHERYLNTAVNYVMAPAPELDGVAEYTLDDYGRKYFPWLREFFLQGFEPPRSRPTWVPPEVPLEIIPVLINLALVKRCYEGGYYQNPKVRQAMVLGGPKGAGKTFYVRGILGALLGPVADGSTAMVEGSVFTSTIAEKPVNFIDDSTPANSPEYHRRFTSLMKKLAAQKVMHYNKKYGGDGQVEWVGTTVLALNLDPESLRSLPSLDQSNMEKTSLFQMKYGIDLPGEDEQAETLKRELPFFARFLLNWKPPEWTFAPQQYRGRYGVRAYHHEELREASASTGTTAAILNIMRDMLDDWRESEDQVGAALNGAVRTGGKGADRTWTWTGRATKLHKELSQYNPNSMAKISAAQVESAMTSLASREFGVTKGEAGRWIVKFDDALLRPFDPAANTEHA